MTTQWTVSQRSEKFKRKLFHDNLNRVKSLASQVEEVFTVMRKSVDWNCRLWISKAFFLFLLITYFFELYMLPLGLTLAILVNCSKAFKNSQIEEENTIDNDKDKEAISPSTDDSAENDEGDGNVSLNKIMQIVQVTLGTWWNIFVYFLVLRMHFLWSREFLVRLPLIQRRSKTLSTSASLSSASWPSSLFSSSASFSCSSISGMRRRLIFTLKK